MRKWSANTWILLSVGVLLLLIGLDAGYRSFARPGQAQPGTPARPAFGVGDPAPDFELPDRTGTPRRLSGLVRRDTLLCFTCGCANCIDLQTYLGILVRKMGSRAPDVISVTTMPTEREESYVRDTGLRQRFLYEPKEGPVMKLYRGHPCPRVYRLKGDRTVAWIGSSPGELPFLKAIGDELAAELGFPPGTVPPQGEAAPGPPAAPGRK